MTILTIHNYYKQRGGEDVVFENEVKTLKEFGHNVIVYTKHNREIDNYNFFKKLLFFLKSFYNYQVVKEIKSIIKNNKIDIAHIHNVFPLISPAVYLLLKKNNIKIVQTLHNFRFLCPNALFFTKNRVCTKCLSGNFLHCIINKCYKDSFIFSTLYALIISINKKTFKKKIDRYIALTNFTKNIFAENGFNSEKIVVKSNPFFKQKTKRGENLNYFLYLGRISYEKGVEFLLESFTKLTEYKLVVAGTGEKLDQYKKMYSSSNIEYLGFVEGNRKINLIQHATAIIIPSICYENFPMAIAEAFSIGTPVIASEIGSIPFIVQNNTNGLLFKTGDLFSLKDACKILIQDGNKREEMGDNGHKQFLQEMEITKNIKKLVEIYLELL